MLNIIKFFKSIKQWEPCEKCGSYCWGKCSKKETDFPY